MQDFFHIVEMPDAFLGSVWLKEMAEIQATLLPKQNRI